VSCETHYVSAGQTVKVIRDRRVVALEVHDGHEDATTVAATHTEQAS